MEEVSPVYQQICNETRSMIQSNMQSRPGFIFSVLSILQWSYVPVASSTTKTETFCTILQHQQAKLGFIEPQPREKADSSSLQARTMRPYVQQTCQKRQAQNDGGSDRVQVVNSQLLFFTAVLPVAMTWENRSDSNDVVGYMLLYSGEGTLQLNPITNFRCIPPFTVAEVRSLLCKMVKQISNQLVVHSLQLRCQRRTKDIFYLLCTHFKETVSYACERYWFSISVPQPRCFSTHFSTKLRGRDNWLKKTQIRNSFKSKRNV